VIPQGRRPGVDLNWACENAPKVTTSDKTAKHPIKADKIIHYGY